MNEPPAPPPPRVWLAWLWAAARAAWILPVPALGGFAALFGAAGMLFHRGAAAALPTAVLGAGLLALAFVAARETEAVLLGEKPMREGAMLGEIATTLAVGAGLAILFLIAAPGYRGLFRKSAEGAMKGNLASLREGVERYKGVNGGRPPQTLAALTIGGAMPTLPELWPSGAGVPHEPTNAVRIVESRTAADSGRWAYVFVRSSPDASGEVFIDCTHTDTRGTFWSYY